MKLAASPKNFPFVEYAGDRAILQLEDGRMFGVPLPAKLERPGKPKKAALLYKTEKDGVPVDPALVELN